MKGNFCFYVVAAVFMSVVFHCSCSRLGEAGLEGNGSIIVFHDSLKSKDRMLQVLPKVIEWLQAEGYELRCLEPTLR